MERMTINGAKALGIDDRAGSIEAGKQADLCALNMRSPETQPLHHVISQLVYAASTRQVSDVWIAGKRLLNGGELTTMDIDELMASAGKWHTRLARLEGQRMGEDEEHEGEC